MSGRGAAQFGCLVAALALAGCSHRLDKPREFVVFFETDRVELTQEAQQILGRVAEDANEYSPSKIVVAGRADGGTAHDASLADQRAAAVARGLIDRGIRGERIEKRADAPPPGIAGVAAHRVIIELLP